MIETICNACLIESSLRGDRATHCIHAVAELEREKEKIAEQERLHKEAQQADKQAERRELFKQVALVYYKENYSQSCCPINGNGMKQVIKITEGILSAADEFSKKDSHE